MDHRHILLITIITLLLCPSEAFAYVDPGVGSYVFQTAIAGVLAALYTIRRYSHAIRTFLSSRRRKPRHEQRSTSDELNGSD